MPACSAQSCFPTDILQGRTPVGAAPSIWVTLSIHRCRAKPARTTPRRIGFEMGLALSRLSPSGPAQYVVTSRYFAAGFSVDRPTHPCQATDLQGNSLSEPSAFYMALKLLIYQANDEAGWPGRASQSSRWDSDTGSLLDPKGSLKDLPSLDTGLRRGRR